MRISPTIFY